MQKKHFRSLLCLSVLFLASCTTNQKIAALKPEPDDAAPLVYENVPSYINMPIQIKIKDIENQTNKFLTGLIYEDNNIDDDDLEVKIWKQAPISMTVITDGTTNKIKTVLPLKAVVKYRIGTNKLGIALYNTKEFNFNGNVILMSSVLLTNWKLNTTTELKSLDWNESPTVNVLGKSIPITYLINPAIKLSKSKIEKSIDQAISQSMDFKPNVLDALDKICQPFEMSPAYQSWLRIVPLELYSTNSKLQKEHISFEMGLKCYIESLVGQKPSSKFDKSKIVLKPVTKIPDNINANVVAISTYQDASRIISENFKGQEFNSGSKKVKVQNVEVWHKDNKMVLALDLLGSLNGKIYLTGYPQYNEQTKEIYFDKLDYVIDTKDKLIKTANWLVQSYVLKKIQESCRYSIKSNLDEGKQNIMKYLSNYSPMEGVYINGSVNDVAFQKIQLTNKAIIAFINVKGTIDVKVDGIK